MWGDGISKKNNCNAVTVTLNVFIFHLKSSISMKYKIHQSYVLVINTCKKHKKQHISPLKSIK